MSQILFFLLIYMPYQKPAIIVRYVREQYGEKERKPNKDARKCKIWVENCGRKYFTIGNVKKDTYICSVHFVCGKDSTEEHLDPIKYGIQVVFLVRGTHMPVIPLFFFICHYHFLVVLQTDAIVCNDCLCEKLSCDHFCWIKVLVFQFCDTGDPGIRTNTMLIISFVQFLYHNMTFYSKNNEIVLNEISLMNIINSNCINSYNNHYGNDTSQVLSPTCNMYRIINIWFRQKIRDYLIMKMTAVWMCFITEFFKL